MSHFLRLSGRISGWKQSESWTRAREPCFIAKKKKKKVRSSGDPLPFGVILLLLGGKGEAKQMTAHFARTEKKFSRREYVSAGETSADELCPVAAPLPGKSREYRVISLKLNKFSRTCMYARLRAMKRSSERSPSFDGETTKPRTAGSSLPSSSLVHGRIRDPISASHSTAAAEARGADINSIYSSRVNWNFSSTSERSSKRVSNSLRQTDRK